MQPMLNIAVRAARAGGRILLNYFERTDLLKVTAKRPNDFVTEVDRGAEAAIVDVLLKAYPDHSILAEEGGARPGKDEFQWIIDPLDGTTNYLHGFPQFSISIALRARGQLEVGVVYDPLREELFVAHKGGGARLNDRKIRVTPRKELEGALLGTGFPYRDHRHLDAYLGMFRDLLTRTAGIRRPGSAALDLAYVAAGRIDGFWELGLAPWDMAAGALLVREAGGVVTDLGGGERFLDTGNIVAGGLRLHGALLRQLKPHLGQSLTA